MRKFKDLYYTIQRIRLGFSLIGSYPFFNLGQSQQFELNILSFESDTLIKVFPITLFEYLDKVLSKDHSYVGNLIWGKLTRELDVDWNFYNHWLSRFVPQLELIRSGKHHTLRGERRSNLGKGKRV